MIGIAQLACSPENFVELSRPLYDFNDFPKNLTDRDLGWWGLLYID